MRILLLSFLLIISCETKNEVYGVKGTIRSIDKDKRKALIAHDTIPDLMMPMVMPFQIKDQKELDQLRVGDSVHFEFVWSDTSPYAEAFTIVGEAQTDQRQWFGKPNIRTTIDTYLDLTDLEIDSETDETKTVFLPNMSPVLIKNKSRTLGSGSKGGLFISESNDPTTTRKFSY